MLGRWLGLLLLLSVLLLMLGRHLRPRTWVLLLGGHVPGLGRISPSRVLMMVHRVMTIGSTGLSAIVVSGGRISLVITLEIGLLWNVLMLVSLLWLLLLLLLLLALSCKDSLLLLLLVWLLHLIVVFSFCLLRYMASLFVVSTTYLNIRQVNL